MTNATDIASIKVVLDVYEVRDIITGLLVEDIKCRMDPSERIR